MDSQKIHKAFVQMAKQLEQMSGHNECCSAPSPYSVPAWDLCEKRTFAKQINVSTNSQKRNFLILLSNLLFLVCATR
jgi:hypothetical protein